MANVNLDDVVALVPDRIEHLEKKGRIRFFPKTRLFEKILSNPVPGGGNSCTLTATVQAPEFDVYESDLMENQHTTGDVYIDLVFPYKNIKGEFTLTKLALNKLSGGKQRLNYMDKRIMNGTMGYTSRLEKLGINGIGGTGEFHGLKRIFTGAAYGGVTRTDTVTFGATVTSLTRVLGDITVVEFGPGDTVDESKIVFDIGAYIDTLTAGEEVNEGVHNCLREILDHANLSGHEVDCIEVGRSVWAALMANLDKKGSPGVLGKTRAFTVAGDGKGMEFGTAKITMNRTLEDDEALLLNTDYLYVPGVEGFDLAKPYLETEVSAKYAAARQVQIIGSGVIATDAPVAHRWVKNMLGAPPA